MGEIRELKQLAASVPRQIEYRKADPRRRPRNADKYLFGAASGVLAGAAAAAAYSMAVAASAAGLGTLVGSVVCLASMYWRAYSADMRHWVTEVVIHGGEREDRVRPEIIRAGGHIRRPNVALPPGFLDSLRALAAETDSLSRRRLHSFGVIADRNNNEQYEEAIELIRRSGWTDDGKSLNETGKEELR